MPGAADDGLIARSDGAPLIYDRDRKSIASALDPDVSPALTGEYTLGDGRRAVPAFALLAARYLDDRYSPDVVANRSAFPQQRSGASPPSSLIPHSKRR